MFSTRLRYFQPSAFVILLPLFLLMACSKTVKEYYPDGSIKSEITYKRDQMNGAAVWYYQNGNVQMESTYVDGKLSGNCTRWYVNGNIERVDHFEENIKYGQSIKYDEAGRKIAEENFLNDTLEGAYFEWHTNGQLMIEGRLSKGLFTGEWKYYDEKGLAVGSGIFDRGTGQLTGYYWNGKLKREVSYRNNLKHGFERWYSENGELSREIIFEDGKIEEVITGDTLSINQKF